MSNVGEPEMVSFNQSSVTNQPNVSLTNCDQVNTHIAYPIYMTIYSLVFLIGLLLNGFILKFHFCGAQPRASSSIRVYLKNLTAADFLLCLCLPLRITSFASNSVPLHLVNCSVGVTALYLNMYASILFMGYISAYRYLKIVRGNLGTHFLQKVRAAYIISTATWVFLLAFMSAYIILWFLTHKTVTSLPFGCQELHSDQLTLLYHIIYIISTVIFLSALISMAFFYYSTSRRVSQAQQSQPESSNSSKLVKSRRNMLMLVCVFCFCFIPYHLVRFPKAFLWRYCSWRKVFYYLMELTVILSVLNVCLDPLIYFYFCKAFRTRLNQGVVFRN